MIKIQKLYKKYKNSEKFAVENLSLHINKGEIYGLLGTNGAGKTTVFSIISGLRKSTSGKIEVAGKNVKTELNDIKQITGIVPQEIALFPTLSVYENLRFFGRMYGLKRSEINKRIEYLLKSFQIDKNTIGRHQKTNKFNSRHTTQSANTDIRRTRRRDRHPYTYPNNKILETA